MKPTLSAQKSPRGKLPWIEYAGARIPDSSIIARWLERRADVLGEADVPTDVRARAGLAQRTAEESLYFLLLAERWMDPQVRARYASDLLAELPRLARPIVTRVATRMLLRQLWQQGYGRHELSTLVEMARADFAGLSYVLGAQPYFTGDRPRAVDASVFGLLANLWYIPIDTPIRGALGEHPSLLAFLERMRVQYVADVPVVLPASRGV